jgi:predicted helicase
MSTDHRAELAKIRTFPSLVRYLRDEMGWPIQADDFDELTFEYSPEELGIDPANAAKIQEIKRLRPLSAAQPWGIFFVKFEPKKLPVVALRRILSQVALKKRASANSAERAAWAADDLLFISNYGVGDERQISFAHFSKPHDSRDLPTLKVLGWDNLDTALHLDAVARGLTEHLTWPDDDTDVEAWRNHWRAAFTLRHGEVIQTSKDLSIRLAELARAIRDRIKTALRIETESGPLTKLMKVFKEALVHDLDADGFADMYAQTIAYGLLSARIADPEKKTADDFAGHMRTNPFLRELMETFLKVGGRHGKAGGPGIDFDELGVSEVVQLLDDANMEAVVRDFDDRNPEEDPVIHFYELFLKEYDSKKRMQRGVFYTPRPVVTYIVRSVHELLRTEFGLEDGLADTATWGEMAKRHKDLEIPEGVLSTQDFVQILDPATGTGTFLSETIDLIHKTLVAKWKARGHGEKEIEVLWNEYVPKHLLPRLHGYEIMMAPYAITHLKIGLKLHETRYHFGSGERARIYLTNALEPAHDFSGKFAFTIPALAQEAQAVNEIKQKQQFTVVIGNPPYSGISGNMSPAIRATIDPYRTVDGQLIKEKGALQFEKNLNDDYVKFVRYAESRIENNVGVIGLITNNAYLESATLRGLRSHLLDVFSTLWFLDLHGDSDKREIAETGGPDENVFDIKHGVVVATLVRRPGIERETRRKGTAFRLDLKASRNDKYHWLLANSQRTAVWTKLNPRFDRYLFLVENTVVATEYESHVSVTDLLTVSSTGFESGRDQILTAFTKEELRSRIHAFCTEPAEKVRKEFDVAEGWGDVLFKARKSIVKDPAYDSRFRRFLFGPFDVRWCFYRKDLLKTNSFSAGKHLCYGRNLALIVMRQVSLDSCFSHVGVSDLIVNNRCFYSTKGKVSYFPIFLYSGESDLIREKGDLLGSNLHAEELERWARLLGLRWTVGNPDSPSLDGALTALDVTRYIYATLHSASYRLRYSEFLRLDFPRIPIPGSLTLFRELARLGGELVAVHLLETPKIDHFMTTYTGPKNPEVVRVGWSDDTVWLDAIATKKGQPTSPGSISFRGVPEAVWGFQIGGYQVCEKWLKDRTGRKLTKDDIAHYQNIVVSIAETIRLMKEIDEVIEAHGGWPGAFVGKAKTISNEKSEVFV